MSNKKDAEIAVADYIREQNKSLGKLMGVSSTHSKASKKIDSKIVLVVCLLVALGISYVLGTKINTSAARKYLESQEGTISSINDLTYKDSYCIYENQFLGNDVNVGLNGGQVYGNSELTVLPSSDGTQTIATTTTGSFTLCDGIASNLNYYGGKIYYVNPFRQLMVCDESGNSTVFSEISQPVRNVVIMDNTLYYQTESNSVERYNLKTGETATVTTESVKSFACLGGDILYLTFSRDLKLLHNVSTADSAQGSTIARNIDKFFYNGDVIAQNADKILSFEVDGSHQKSLADGVQSVVGADYSHVVYQKDGILYDHNTLDGEILPLSEGEIQGIISSVNNVNSKWFAIKRVRTENDYTYECSYLN